MIVRTERLDIGYGKRVVASDINLDILKGQFVGLLGPNGCGKSTLLRTLARMLAPLGGQVRLEGRNLCHYDRNELARTMAVVLTERFAAGMLTAFDIASMGRYPYTGLMGRLDSADIAKTWDALATVGATDLADRYFNELSDGEKQKVLFARALAQEPEVIVLDEPTSHLDARNRVDAMLILRRLVREKGVTILASLHDIDLSLKVCDLVILVKDGRVISFGPPEEVLIGDNVAALYDMERASFDSDLGGIELRNGKGEGCVFVVGGAGSASRLYRILSKHGFGVITGVLPENDIDYYVAKATGAVVFGERAYRDISPASYAMALEGLSAAEQVVDAGFPIEPANRPNADLVLAAVAKGKTTHTLRPDGESRQQYGAQASRIISSQSVSALLRRLFAVECLRLAG